MNDEKLVSRGNAALLGLLLALGLIVGGWVLGAQIKATRLSDRYVTVKGLVERKVKSDLAVWPLTYKEAGDDLSLVYAKAESDKKAILEFLADQGIQSSEIELGVIRVVDTQANEYGGATRAASPLYCRTANHGADFASRPGCGGGAENHAAVAERHCVEHQSWPGIDLPIYRIEFHQARHDHRSDPERPRCRESFCGGFRQQGGFDSAGEPGRVLHTGRRLGRRYAGKAAGISVATAVS